EIAGSAHFLEHMVAGGSTKRIQLSRSIENSGGILDFYTEREYMMTTINTLPSAVAEESLIISKLIFDKCFEEEKFNQERKIILNELSEASDDPTEKVEELLLKTLFKMHPMKRPVGGFPKTVKRLSLDKLSYAYEENYVPQNMILILTGNFSEKTAKEVLEEFGSKTADKTFSVKANAVESGKPKPLVVEKKAGLAQTYLSIGARTVCSNHKDGPTLDLISTILSGGASSRLFIELREKNALTYDVTSDHNMGVDWGYFNVNCAVKNKNLAKAKDLIVEEFSKLRSQKVPLNEIERSKNLIIADILRCMDNPQQSSDVLAYMEMQFNDEKSLVNYIAGLKNVSDENIIDAANTYLKEDCFSTVLLKPKN
ncbi:MAG TPA: pitrilysin family protein, partial [Candidatus Acidoferrum sp.]|nr:pitrilysin family protein [Candidatus Acidoferrum sp.]